MTSLSPIREKKTPKFTQIYVGSTYINPSESEQDVDRKLEGRSLLMFLTNNENGASLLVPAATNYAHNSYFRNLIVEVDKPDLEPYNLTSIPLQDKQLVIILTDMPLTVSTIMTMSTNDFYSLKMKVIQCFQIVDTFQSYVSMGQDLRYIVSNLLTSLIQDNQRFWGKLRDDFPAFSLSASSDLSLKEIKLS